MQELAPQSQSLTLNTQAFSPCLVITKIQQQMAFPTHAAVFFRCAVQYLWLEFQIKMTWMWKMRSRRGSLFFSQEVINNEGYSCLSGSIIVSLPYIIRDIVTLTHTECLWMGTEWLPLILSNMTAVCGHDNSAVGQRSWLPHATQRLGTLMR